MSTFSLNWQRKYFAMTSAAAKELFDVVREKNFQILGNETGRTQFISINSEFKFNNEIIRKKTVLFAQLVQLLTALCNV